MSYILFVDVEQLSIQLDEVRFSINLVIELVNDIRSSTLISIYEDTTLLLRLCDPDIFLLV